MIKDISTNKIVAAIEAIESGSLYFSSSISDML